MFSLILRLSLVLAVAAWPFQKENRSASLKKSQLEIPQQIQDLQWVRVSLAEKVSEITLETNNPYVVLDADGRSLFRGERMTGVKVRSNGEGIQLGSQTFGRPPLTIRSEGDGIQVGERIYRHGITLFNKGGGKISVVNEINVEDYLRGVLPWEANPGWHPEALKAQAVASRTYVLFHAIERKHQDFAVTTSVMSQVYKGRGIEKQSTDEAIQRTHGEVLTYKGKIFPAYFHSTCGGHTTQADHIWDVEQHPSLKGVVCNFCLESKHFRWQDEFSENDIRQALAKNGVQVGEIKEIRPADVGASGRARYFEIVDNQKTHRVHSNYFRLWVDPGKFKSTQIRAFEKSGGKFFVRGYGWGHGVGMCQYGMKRLADLGYDYRQILEYYYPGSQITKIRYS